MPSVKKSMLIYFDSYPMVITLPPEQRGWLFTALMVYGDRLCRAEDPVLEEVMEQFPLSPEARIVCGFMAGSILRDTRRWLARQKARSKPEPPGSAGPAADQQAREDMERMRRLMEQCREEPGPSQQAASARGADYSQRQKYEL